MKTVLELIKKLFPIRSCSLNLTEENINAHKFKVCLDYHIGLCKGPCEGLQSKEDYARNIENIRHILKGNLQEVTHSLNERLDEAVANLNFEEAQLLKDKLVLLQRFQAKSMVVNPNIGIVDVFSIHSNESYAFVNYMHVRKGAVITTDTIMYKKRMEEEDSEILALAIVELREKYKSPAREIIIPFPLLIRVELPWRKLCTAGIKECWMKAPHCRSLSL
jgi:excinuclease ABC subunit C